MPKLKTHTGAKKRFSKTGTGKIKRHQTKTRHILSSKSPKVKRKLGKMVLVSDGDYAKVARMIPYACACESIWADSLAPAEKKCVLTGERFRLERASEEV